MLIALWFAGPWFREEILRHATHGVALALAETLQVPSWDPAPLACDPVFGWTMTRAGQEDACERPRTSTSRTTVLLPAVIRAAMHPERLLLFLQMGSGGLGREDVLELCLAVLHVKTKRAALEAVQLTPDWATFFWTPFASHRIEAKRHISNGH